MHEATFSKRIMVLILTVLLSAGITPIHAQQAPDTLLEEAPEALLEAEIGDAEVDLFVTGRLSSTVQPVFSRALRLDADEDRLVRYPFPGLAATPFTNTVDLTLSLWLMERYFFETQLADEFQLGTLLFGYQGFPGELVQSVLIGNTAVGIDTYPYLRFGPPVEDAPGASARFETDTTVHEALARLERSTTVRRTFIGTDEITETTARLGDYVRGRFFQLPDAGVAGLTLYEARPDGSVSGSDGRRYRRLDLATETRFSLSAGTLALEEPATGKLLAYYTVGGVPVGTAGTGQNAFNLLTEGSPDPDRPADLVFGGSDVTAYLAGDPEPHDDLPEEAIRVIVDGREAVVLYEPGRFSPFERLAFYSVAADDAQSSELSLSGRNGATLSEQVTPVRADEGLVRLAVAGAPARGFAARYPLAAPDLSVRFQRLYGRGPQPLDPAVAGLTVAGRIPGRAIQLPTGVVPGSLSVTRAAAAAGSFSLTDDGTLRLTPPPGATERITVSYRLSGAGTGADASFALANRLQMNERSALSGAVAARWSPTSGGYSAVPEQHQGYVLGSVGASFEGSALSVETAAAGAVSFADTTGALLVDGMDGRSVALRIGATTVYPAPRPRATPAPTDGASGAPSFALTEANRGALHFVDYYVESGFGGLVLQPLSYTPPPQKQYPYEDGGRIGPYIALAGSAAVNGPVMVLDYVLPEADTWAGAVVRSPGAQNLSDTSEISFRWRLTESDGDVRVFVQAGSLAEDLDADGTLDAGSSALSPHFTFSTPQAAFTVGHPELTVTAAYSEDADGDGLLDLELVEQMVTRELAVSNGDTWQQARLLLSAEEQRRLGAVTGLRVIVVREAAGEVSGLLQIADPEFRSSAQVAAVISPEPTVWTRTVPEPEIGRPGLEEQLPEIAARFGNPGATNSVLSVTWSGRSEPFTLTHAVTPIPPGRYGTLRLVYRLDAAAAAAPTLTASLVPVGIDAAFRLLGQQELRADGEWHEVSFVVPEDLSFSAVNLEVDGGSDGLVHLDNLSFWDPRAGVGASARLNLTWRPPLELRLPGGPEARRPPLLANPELTLRIDAESEGLPQAAGIGGEQITGYAQLSGTVLGAQALGSVSTRTAPSGSAVSAVHELSIPLWRFTLAERFLRGFLKDAGLQEQTLAASVVLHGLHADTQWSANNDQTHLRQRWTTSTAVRGTGETISAYATAAARASQDSELDGLPASFGTGGWLAGFRAMAPAPAPGPRRSAELSAAGAVLAGPADAPASGVGVEMDGELTFGLRTAADPWRVTGQALLRVPVGIRATTASLSVAKAYRAGRAAVPLSVAGVHPVSADLRLMADDLSGAGPLLLLAPIVELFSPATMEHFTDATGAFATARYTPSVTAEVARDVQSRVSALLLPTRTRVTIERSLERAQDAVSAEQRLRVELSTVAVNLFGTLGSATRTTAFDGDEYATSVRVLGTRKENTGAVDVTASGNHSARLFWTDGRNLELTARWSGGDATSLTGSGAYRWSATPLSIFGIDGFQFLVDAGARYEHTVTGEVSLDAGRSAWSRVVTATAGWEARMQVPERGSAGVSVVVGGGAERGGTQADPLRLLLGALSVGIDGRLEL